MTLQNSLTEVFSSCQLNYNCCLLTIGINTVAVFKDSEQSFKIFYAHSRDLHGMPHSFGKCTLLTIEGIENLVSYLQISGISAKSNLLRKMLLSFGFTLLTALIVEEILSREMMVVLRVCLTFYFPSGVLTFPSV